MAIPLGSGIAIFICSEPMGTGTNGSNLLDASLYLSLHWLIYIDTTIYP